MDYRLSLVEKKIPSPYTGNAKAWRSRACETRPGQGESPATLPGRALREEVRAGGWEQPLFLVTLKRGFQIPSKSKSRARSNTSAAGAGSIVFILANEQKVGSTGLGGPLPLPHTPPRAPRARKSALRRVCHSRN